MTKALNIAIIGAGIGGLTAGALLARSGHQVTVFDQFDAPLPVGSGLVIQPVGQAVLAEIGALVPARHHGRPIWRMDGREINSGRQVLKVDYGDHGGPRFGLAIQRPALFDCLYQAAMAAGVTVQTSARITGAGSGILTLADATQTTRFDLVVDSSGASSTLSGLKSKPLPFGALWGTVPWPEAGFDAGELRQRYRRADRMIGIMPSGTRPGDATETATIFWSLPRNGHDDWTSSGLAAWHDEIAGLWPEALPVFQQITDPAQMTFAHYSHGTVRRTTGDRLAVIGDAAHRASPQLGQGANMAMLDAFALGEALKRGPVPEALNHFARARRWHVRIYQAMSYAFTPQYQSHSRALPVLRDRLLFPVSMVPPIPSVLTRLVSGDFVPPLASLTPPDFGA